MKGRRFTYYSKAKKEGDKGFPKEIGSILLSDTLAQYVDDNDERIGVVINHMPDIYMNAYPDRPKPPSEDTGGY